jgi:hypothetical protein
LFRMNETKPARIIRTHSHSSARRSPRALSDNRTCASVINIPAPKSSWQCNGRYTMIRRSEATAQRMDSARRPDGVVEGNAPENVAGWPCKIKSMERKSPVIGVLPPGSRGRCVRSSTPTAGAHRVHPSADRSHTRLLFGGL